MDTKVDNFGNVYVNKEDRHAFQSLPNHLLGHYFMVTCMRKEGKTWHSFFQGRPMTEAEKEKLTGGSEMNTEAIQAFVEQDDGFDTDDIPF